MPSRPRTQFIASLDGTALLLRHRPRQAAGRHSVLLGHAMSIHSGLLDDLMEQFSAAGCDVWAGDLRGHGGSVSARAPLAHLSPDGGWDRLIDDMDAFARVAFDGVPTRHRVMVGGVMSCQVMLSLLLRHPDRAGQLVMAPPTPHRAGASRLASAFLGLRRLTHALDQPDPQVMHHIYGFLKGGLPPGARDVDVISARPEVIARILDDPRGFPTPTLGYWLAVLPGLQHAWDQRHAALEAALRVLIVSSPDDPHLNGPQFAPQVRGWFQDHGVRDVRYLSLPGTRSNPMVDARHVPFAARVMDWLYEADAEALPPPPGAEVPAEGGVPSPYAAAIGVIGLPADAAAPELPDLIRLCYDALDDEARWIELIYRLCLASEQDAPQVERLLEQVQPHWQRSFELREELRKAATLGVLYAEVIDRLALGVALLDADGRLRHANAAFRATLAALMPDPGGAGPEAAVARLLAAQPGTGAGTEGGERPVLWDGLAIGVSFVPASLQHASLRQSDRAPRGPAPRLMVLRDPGQTATAGDDRAGLLSLAFGLTGQESAVALGLAEGLSTEAIGERLAIGDSTVRSHLKQVFSKMQVSSRTELASRIMASPIGWLSPGPRGAGLSPTVAPPADWTRLP